MRKKVRIVNTNRNCEIYNRLAIAKNDRIARFKREMSEFQDKKQIRIELKKQELQGKKQKCDT